MVKGIFNEFVVTDFLLVSSHVNFFVCENGVLRNGNAGFKKAGCYGDISLFLLVTMAGSR